MYANQVCSRIRRAFCKRTGLKPQERQSNGIYSALVGRAQRCVEPSLLNVYSALTPLPQALTRTNLPDHFFALDVATRLLHSTSSSNPAKKRVPSDPMFAFSLVRCVANLLTLLFSNFI
jgi:hypothetical protein